jgi:signal transduction histidine kinase/DNA-binding response OmpR family regulator
LDRVSLKPRPAGVDSLNSHIETLCTVLGKGAAPTRRAFTHVDIPKIILTNNDRQQANLVHMEQEQSRIRNIVRLGFAAVLGLTFLLGMVGLYQLHKFKTTMTHIVDVGNEKTALAIRMRDAIRLRALTVQRMLATDDYFSRDRELLQYYEYSGMYREARQALFAMPMTDEERQIHKTLTEMTNIAQPKNRNAAEMLLMDPVPAQFDQVLDDAIAVQRELLQLLDQFVLLQKRYAKRDVTDAEREFQSTIMMMIVVVAMLLFVGSVIAKRVTHLVTSKNTELEEKNRELEAAWFEAANATRAKSKFLANMSHEIRTPLTSIIGFAETLGEPHQAREDLAHAAESIKRSGNHLHQIINDVLDISKIEAGQIELETMPVSPVAVVSEVAAMMKAKVQQKGINFRTNFYFPLPRKVITDPTRLRQILLNLLGNAVKFTDQGIVCINVYFLPVERLMKFEVSDTGIGMSEENLAKVFEPFSQAEKSTTRKFGGTGLGLSISKQLAEKMGGDIVGESIPSEGSTFAATIGVGDIGELELMYEMEEPDDTTDSETTVLQRDKFAGTVLLAEDTPENQQLIKLQLNKAGIDVVLANNGREAVDAALEREFDLILMDIQMPVLHGLDAIRLLRHAGYSNPIVALTANTSQSDRDECLDAGADDFLTKPIDFSKFFNVLTVYIPQRDGKSGVSVVSALPPVDTLEEEPPLFEDEEMKKLLDAFLSNLPYLVQSIQQAVIARDWEQLKSLSHQLKGLGGSFGYDYLSEIAKNIYLCARDHREQELDQYADELQHQYQLIQNNNNGDARQVV